MPSGILIRLLLLKDITSTILKSLKLSKSQTIVLYKAQNYELA